MKKLILTTIIVISLLKLIPIFNFEPRLFDDETNYIEMSLRYGINKWEPQHYMHGTLYPKLLFIPYSLYYVAGGFSPETFILKYLREPKIFFLIARLVVWFCSLVCLWLVVKIGEEL